MNCETLDEEEGLQLLAREVPCDASKFALDYDFHLTQEYQKETLRIISSTLEDNQLESSPILWLYGEAGSGKTSLARILSDQWQSSERLGGSFFFQKGAKGHVEGNYLFPSLACQLAMNVPELRKPINGAVLQARSFLSESIYEQFLSLIVSPVQGLPNSLSRPRIIVIDGIDACEGPDGTRALILKCIADSTQLFKLPFRFLITSRPESQICQAFDEESLRKATVRVPLPLGHPSLSTIARSAPSVPTSLDAAASRRFPRSAAKEPFYFPSFPRIVTLQQRNGHAESYCRSLLLEGHGFPIWRPSGNLAMPPEILKRGVSMGDVGTIDKDGFFQYLFNIFHPADHPVNKNFTPREFHAIEPTLQVDEIVYNEEYFKPGHVVASKGVTIARHSENPLDISFSSSEPEGAILVLPSGASRQDLVSTTRFHEYARKNAPHWYQFINNYSGITDANGSLFLVTGCDKSNDWAIAAFPCRTGGAKRVLDLRYRMKVGRDTPWVDNGTAETNFYDLPQQLKELSNEKNQCLFVRGLRISLTQQSWRKTLPYPEFGRLHYTFLLHSPPKFHIWLNSILVFLRLRLSEEQAVEKIGAQEQHFFHPNYLIGQVLLAAFPEAEVALVDDRAWCSLVHDNCCTLLNMEELVSKVLNVNSVVEKDGVVSLFPKTNDGLELAQVASNFKLGHRAQRFTFLSRKKGPIRWVKTVPAYKHAKLF